jgi:hypothetical protein
MTRSRLAGLRRARELMELRPRLRVQQAARDATAAAEGRDAAQRALAHTLDRGAPLTVEGLAEDSASAARLDAELTRASAHAAAADAALAAARAEASLAHQETMKVEQALERARVEQRSAARRLEIAQSSEIALRAYGVDE